MTIPHIIAETILVALILTVLAGAAVILLTGAPEQEPHDSTLDRRDRSWQERADHHLEDR